MSLHLLHQAGADAPLPLASEVRAFKQVLPGIFHEACSLTLEAACRPEELPELLLGCVKMSYIDFNLPRPFPYKEGMPTFLES